MDVEAALAAHVQSTDYEDVPEKVRNHAKRWIRDYVGQCIYGTQFETGSKIVETVSTGPNGRGTHVFGVGEMDPESAVLANGVTGHAKGWDDTFESVVIHPSCTVFPAAFASTELEGGDGTDLLTAYTVGLDVVHRIGRSVAPVHWHHGWHSTATIGVFGAAAATASVLDLDETEFRNALGLAGSFSAGLKSNTGTMAMAVHCGNAAQMGFRAATMAGNGVTANQSILCGEYGYGEMMTPGGAFDPEEILDPAVEWAVLDNGIKPYPSGVVTHASMEALRRLVERGDLDPSDVETIRVDVDEQVTDTIGNPNPKDVLEASGSYHFCLAAILRRRTAGIYEFQSAFFEDPETKRQMEKVSVNPVCGLFPEESSAEASYGSRVTLETADGRTLVEEQRGAPGTPSHPLSEERLLAKFHDCAEVVLSHESAIEVKRAIDELEVPGSLDRLRDASVPS